MDNNKTYRISEILVSSFLAIFSGVMLYVAYHSKGFASSMASRRSGPAPMDFPKIFLFALLFLSLFLLSKSVKKLKDEWKSEERIVFFEGKAFPTMALLVFYAVMWKYIGFTLSSLLVYFAEAKYLEPERSAAQISLVTIAVVGASYLLFHKLFMIPFPEPLLPFLK
jgi:hypothetical protein